jgi:hypothetical protein
MSNFRTKLLGLAALATLFAGASYGQNGITSCSSVTLGVTPGPTNMRAEGTTELAGDDNFSCNNNLASTSATVTVFASAAVTSQVVNTTTGATEATLFICGNTTSACTSSTGTPYSGTVSGSQITFSGITIPAGNFSGRISNVRMNASAVTIASTLTTATETVLASANNTSAATLATTVGFVFKSLAAPALVANPNGANTATITAYTTCAGNALSATTPRLISFGVVVGETFGGAFKAGNGPSSAGGEGGSYQSGTAGVGTAISGTKIQLVFANLNPAMTVYVPTSINSTGTGDLSMVLVSSATAADPVSPVAASTATGAPGAASPTFNGAYTETTGASAALTTASGSATAVYEITSSDPTKIQSLVVPVFVVFAPNSITTASTAVTVLESYAPTAAAAAATTVPNFAPPTNTPLSATAVSLCSTNLLFPFVTSVTGFDTGIALSNTSGDPFGTTAVGGTCTLNFYGTGAPTPSTGVAAPGGTTAGGASNAFLLSSVAPNFTGYLIAQCTYQYGHGFAYIVYNFGQNNGATMGYLATVMPNRATGQISESLGQ